MIIFEDALIPERVFSGRLCRQYLAMLFALYHRHRLKANATDEMGGCSGCRI
jgi:hypothetical protein